MMESSPAVVLLVLIAALFNPAEGSPIHQYPGSLLQEFLEELESERVPQVYYLDDDDILTSLNPAAALLTRKTITPRVDRRNDPKPPFAPRLGRSAFASPRSLAWEQLRR